MRIQLAPTVYSDLLEILEYYDLNAGSEVAAEFYVEFRRQAKAAGDRPYSFPRSGRFRRTDLRTFPYHFLFEILGDNLVRILVVRHNSRHPNFGLK